MAIPQRITFAVPKTQPHRDPVLTVATNQTPMLPPVASNLGPDAEDF